MQLIGSEVFVCIKIASTDRVSFGVRGFGCISEEKSVSVSLATDEADEGQDACSGYSAEKHPPIFFLKDLSFFLVFPGVQGDSLNQLAVLFGVRDESVCGADPLCVLEFLFAAFLSGQEKSYLVFGGFVDFSGPGFSFDVPFEFVDVF